MTLTFLKSPRGADPVVVEGRFKVPPERLFRAWTTPEDLLNWFGGDNMLETAKVDLRTGGSWHFTFEEKDGTRDVLHGEYLEVEAPSRLVFSWRHHKLTEAGRGEDTPASEVTLTFEADGEETFMRLVHRHVESEGSRSNIGGGWEASFSKIRALVEETATETAPLETA
ncbi:SRPBCC domain-containing protein [Nisaea acidiphila]|uniref:SRPBCC domain-containing protein n=1 Tax=Nisaea acidiphila TaxID=1862145 RepID=A0A9J7APH9_9PROT|nr:SRPBCC domain-containing protein [Nisaea acidiphila]UUX49523.1 SRPBCC domain-containing protein [Nisaea acidiphila]